MFLLKINHINIANSEGEVYCRLLDKIVTLDENHQKNYCGKCKMYAGSAQGNGVECEWDDVRDLPNPSVVYNPSIEKENIVSQEAIERLKKGKN